MYMRGIIMVLAPKILVKNKRYFIVIIAIFACRSAFITIKDFGLGSGSNANSRMEPRPDNTPDNNVTGREMVDDSSHHDASGYGLAARVRARCANLTQPSPLEGQDASMIKYMIPVPQVRSLYCPLYKVGSTFWRRFIYMIQKVSPFKRKYSHPFEVDISLISVNRPKPPNQAKPSDFENDFKFMFVRDPYKRIASAFVDKLLAPNPLFWKLFGKSAIEKFRGVDKNRKCFHDVTFSEFVQFVVWAGKSRRELDGHIQVESEVCVPCMMKYDFIGKMERFLDDAYDVIDRLQQNATRHALNDSMTSLADDDAVRDSVHSPFTWKIQITRCMSWYEALQRVWRKLQLRGLLEFRQRFPLDETSTRLITAPEFIELANNARRGADPNKLLAQKKHVISEIYRSVPLEVLKEMRTVFQADFDMFEYDSSPAEIFSRSSAYSVENVPVLDFRTHNITIH